MAMVDIMKKRRFIDKNTIAAARGNT